MEIIRDRSATAAPFQQKQLILNQTRTDNSIIRNTAFLVFHELHRKLTEKDINSTDIVLKIVS